MLEHHRHQCITHTDHHHQDLDTWNRCPHIQDIMRDHENLCLQDLTTVVRMLLHAPVPRTNDRTRGMLMTFYDEHHILVVAAVTEAETVTVTAIVTATVTDDDDKLCVVQGSVV